MSSTDDECPICYIKYGEQEDGSFICQDGAINSGEEGYCDHWVCTRCAQTMHNNLRKKDDEDASECCPICRCDWTLWLLTHYDDEEEEEEKEEEQEITPDTIVTGFLVLQTNVLEISVEEMTELYNNIKDSNEFFSIHGDITNNLPRRISTIRGDFQLKNPSQ
jgi:hypothetical protein